MPRTALYLDFDAPIEIERPANTYSDADASTFLFSCLLGASLSRGTFGAAFLLRHHDNAALVRQWVIKLPNMLLRDGLYPRRENDPHEVYLGDALYTFEVEANVHDRALANFETEFQNAEAILEPPLFQHLNRHGGRIRHMLVADWERLMTARDAWKALPGYAHLHPVLHLDATLPALISARADGTLDQLRNDPRYEVLLRRQADGDAPPTWYALARQITSAVAFILKYTPLAHIDIKPANILYTHDGPTPLLQLGDYGLCRPKADAVWQYTWTGTAGYNPPVRRGQLALITFGAQSLLQLAATLIAILCVPRGVQWMYPDSNDRSVCEYALEPNALLNAPRIARDMLRIDPFTDGAEAALQDNLFPELKRCLGVITPVYMQSAGEKRPRES